MIEQILFVAALAILMTGLGVATWYSGNLLRRVVPPFNVLLALPDNILRFVLILVCVALGAWLGPGPIALGWSTDQLARGVVVGLAVAGVLAPLLSVAGNAVIRRWGEGVYDNRLLRALVPANGREWVLVVLALLPAALLEELLFRSLPLGGMTWLASPWVLMWPLSLLFGLMHAAQGEWGVVGTSLMGLILSALFLITGSIWAPLAAHWLLNVAEVTVAWRQGLRPLREDQAPGESSAGL